MNLEFEKFNFIYSYVKASDSDTTTELQGAFHILLTDWREADVGNFIEYQVKV